MIYCWGTYHCKDIIIPLHQQILESYVVSFRNPSGSFFHQWRLLLQYFSQSSFDEDAKFMLGERQWTLIRARTTFPQFMPEQFCSLIKTRKRITVNVTDQVIRMGFRKLCVTFQNLLVVKYICFHYNTCKIPFGVLNICLQFQVSMEKVWITMDARCSRGLQVGAHKPNICSYFDSESILSVEYLNK